MDKYTKEELNEAAAVLAPIIPQLEKMRPKFKEGTPQHTLLIRRIMAFNLAIELMQKDCSATNTEGVYTKEALEGALFAIESTMKKSVKIPAKLKEGSPQHKLLLSRIKAYDTALAIIKDRLGEY